MYWSDSYLKKDAGNFSESQGSHAFHMEGGSPGAAGGDRFSTPANPSLATHNAEQEIPPIQYNLWSHGKQPPLTPMRDVIVEDVEDEEEEVAKPETKEMQYVTFLVTKY